ncbi:hypothetical protein BN6_21680 [Saccharothrix espanaensis DSM 44229]|uniref:Uncharacterized protein n=1 Tax=Saccharothrix espanaensis (strain ATCC 51144 / DSM 44229 / JCM 9112 / NBRC 15066 / NRRL 15764) TaxID=1179773 RepID=K0JQA0_SACES|nr:hypothetical protein BN6_21680 [Saccharothrix espanaensis DSM 44229]
MTPPHDTPLRLVNTANGEALSAPTGGTSACGEGTADGCFGYGWSKPYVAPAGR